ncbi:MAG: hypothetical protein KF862_25990 [Chitinophagaceae bacterium]|nr:hypothetical protein [Chitinophagaceae bacterium]
MQLQGFGEFTMENFYDNPFEHEKGKIKIPENAIRFLPDKKCKEDAGLIEFISKSTGKIKPLAASDLEDFLNIGKQLLNVSKQFYIEGLGTLVLDANDILSFSQGTELIPAAIAEDSIIRKSREIKEDHAGISFSDDYNNASGNNTRKFLITLAVIAGMALIGWAAYYSYNQWQESKNASSVPPGIKPVLPAPATTTADSTLTDPVTDSTKAVTIASNTDSAGASSYRVIIETSQKTRALKRHQDLLNMGYKVELATDDSVTFRLFTNINGPLSDTARVRDSIARFFGRRVIIDLKK